MIYLYLPILMLKSLFGVGVVDAGPAPQPLDRPVPWLNWSTNSCDDDWFWPMLYSVSSTLPTECSGKNILLLNEPEAWNQSNTTPQQAADRLAELNGERVFCCGNLYHASGQQWWTQFVALADTSNLAGINIHIYVDARYGPDVGAMDWWKQEADSLGVPLVISEWGFWPTPGTGYESADMTPLYWQILSHTDADAMFWFAWWMPVPYRQDSPSFIWSDLRLVDDGGAWTTFGQQWDALRPEIMGQ